MRSEDYGSSIDKLSKTSRDEHDGRCEYEAIGQRHSAYGTISPNIRKGGPWYCRFHYSQLQGRLTEQEAAEKVRDRIAAGRQDDWRDMLIAKKIEAMRDDPLMQMAHRISRGDCSRADKRDFLQLLREKISGIGGKLPYDKEKREVVAEPGGQA